jgi:hypothetical protein
MNTRIVSLISLSVLGLSLGSYMLPGLKTQPAIANQARCLAPEVSYSTNSLTVKTSSYLTQNGLSHAAAIALAPDCSLVMAGQLAGTNPFPTSVPVARINLPNRPSAEGAIIRLSATGRVARSLTYIGKRVDDMEMNVAGRIAVAGDFGVAVLNSTATQVLWYQPVDVDSSSAKRVAIAYDGTVAVLSGRKVTTFNAQGLQLGTWTISSNSGWYFNDVAIHSASKSVYATGFYNTYLPSKLPVQVAYLMAYDYTGGSKWKNWAYSGAALTGNEADTRGYRLAIGRDGFLYFQGEAAGGNNIFRWDPRDLTKDLQKAGVNVQFDAYNTTYNTKSNHITYYTRLNPADGTPVKGQYALSRLSSGSGNTIRHGNITADELGNVYVVGQTASSIAQRDVQRINGQTVGTYAGGEGYVIVVSPDFKQRKLWTTWTAGTGAVSQNYQFWGVVASRGVTAVAGSALTNGPLLTHSAMQAQPAPNLSSTFPSAYFSVWAQP